jgi:hypothetical protein
VGTSEGTRAPDGRKTAAWNGHVDPGNQARNQGSFSYQHSAASPKDADLQQIKKFKDILLPKFLKALPNGWLKQRSHFQLLFLVAADLYTQSEIACTGRGGFLDHLKIQDIFTPTKLIEWRVQSYIDPTTGRLDAPGFSNSLERLKADQQRRTEAVIDTAQKLEIF